MPTRRPSLCAAKKVRLIRSLLTFDPLTIYRLRSAASYNLVARSQYHLAPDMTTTHPLPRGGTDLNVTLKTLPRKAIRRGFVCCLMSHINQQLAARIDHIFNRNLFQTTQSFLVANLEQTSLARN